jgi:cytosine/adenosine deaminase-related metal-dependent hydrolase
VEGVLMDNSSGEWKGWLPTTLQFETAVKENPALAQAIAREKFESYIAHGITASLEYTTSSAEAARNILTVAEEMGLKGRIKVGYVCMNQDVNFLQV